MAFSKLLGQDAQAVTPAQAGAAFSEEAKRIAREQNVDLSQAWQIAKRLHPEAHARLCEGALPSVTLDNEKRMATPPPQGAGKALYLAAMELPPDTTDDEFAVCWRANGNRPRPLKAQNVFLALIAYLAGKQGCSIAVARDMAQDRFPDLAKAAGEQKAGGTPLPSTPH